MNHPTDQIYNTLAQTDKNPQVDIQSHINLGDNMIKVVATVHGVNNEADFNVAISSMTNGKGRVIPGSFNKRERIAVATVVANAQSKPLDASFTVLTASTAMDPSGIIWSVVNQDGAKRVVLESNDDLAEILAARQARRKIFANPIEGAGLATANFNNGDLIRYVDSASKTTNWGFVFDTVEGVQVAKEDFTTVNIKPEMIVATVSRNKLDEKARKMIDPIMITAKLSSEKLSQIMTYLTKAFPKGAMANELFAKYRKLAGEAI
jgi:hypothetical protein